MKKFSIIALTLTICFTLLGNMGNLFADSNRDYEHSVDNICTFSSDRKDKFNDRICNNFCNSSCDISCDSSCDKSCDRECQNSALRTSTPIRTQIYYRSVGDNIARELVGWQWELYRPNCENYGATYIAYEYQRTFKNKCLLRPLIGGNALEFAGSLAQNRPLHSLVADNFGLSRTCSAFVNFCPKIENHIVDFGFYAGLNGWCPGLFLKIHMPLVHTRWNLGLKCAGKRLSNCESTPFSTCYVSSAQVTRGSDQTPEDENNLFIANSANTLEQALSGTFLFGDLQTPWRAGRFPLCKRSKTAIADIDFNLGYNWLLTDCYHFGGFVKIVAPTGNRPDHRFIFSPQAGNGHHWEIGAGLTAHAVLWTSYESNLSIWFEGYLTHMLRDKQCRTFDLCNGAFTRYLLLKEFNSTGIDFQYNGNLLSATNFTTRAVDVKINVKGDAAFKLAYRWCGWGVDLGYEIYGNDHETVERICHSDSNICDRGNVRFGIKGTEGVCCNNLPILQAQLADNNGDTVKFIAANGTQLSNITEINGQAVQEVGVPENCPSITTATTALARNNNTQPNANAFTPILGTNRQVAAISDTACTVCLSPDSTAVTEPTPLSTLTAANGYIIANTGNPQFLGEENINFRSGEAPSVLCHKIFAHFNYTWLDDCGWNPHVGIGFEVEFDGEKHYKSKGNKTVQHNNFDRIGFNQWGIWIKGGVSF